MFKINKNRNYGIRENINITNSLLDYVSYKQLSWCGNVRWMNEKGYLKKFWDGEEEEQEDIEIRGCRNESD